MKKGGFVGALGPGQLYRGPSIPTPSVSTSPIWYQYLESIGSAIVKNKKQICVVIGIAALWYLFVRRKWRSLYKSMHLTSLQTVEQEYDYIIVGGGTSGCLLARRLAESGVHSVLLLEAGESNFDENRTMAPGFFTSLWYQSEWPCASVPQTFLNDREFVWHRACTLGGNSTNDTCLYSKGVEEDFARLAEYGISNWSYSDVQDAYQRFEHFHTVNPTTTTTASSGSGSSSNNDNNDNSRLTIEPLSQPSAITNMFLRACDALGFKNNGDCKSPSAGWGSTSGLIYATTKHNHRQHSVNSFLLPIFQSHSNLTIRTRAFVTKVTVDEANSEATGVEWNNNGILQTVRAKREVILTAGATFSPYILLRSGIGPATVTAHPPPPHHHHTSLSKELEIVEEEEEEKKEEEAEASEVERTVRNICAPLPVGEHLVDQVLVPVCFRPTINPSLSADSTLFNLVKLGISVFRFHFFSSGPLAQPIIEATAFPETRPHSVPSLQYLFSTRNYNNFCDISAVRGLQPLHLGYSIIPVLLHPKSTGTLRLHADEREVVPKIDPNYLTNEEDIEALVQGVKTSLEIGNNENFTEAEAELLYLENTDDESIRDYVMKYSYSANNPVGTCRMGTDSSNSVVNEYLQVHGVKNLRVADCSVLPFHLSSCTPRSSSLLIAQRAADFIQTVSKF